MIYRAPPVPAAISSRLVTLPRRPPPAGRRFVVRPEAATSAAVALFLFFSPTAMTFWRILTELYRVLPSFTEFFRLHFEGSDPLASCLELSGRIYLVLPSFTEFTEFYRVLLNFFSFILKPQINLLFVSD